MVDAKSIMYMAMGVAVFFILLSNVVLTQWTSAGNANVTGTGLTSSAFQGILLVVGIAFIFGVAIKLMGKS